MKANDAQDESKTDNGNDEALLIRKQTFDKLLRHKRCDDMIALYVFLSYTALWQRTNQPHATVKFIAKGLRWGVNKVRRIKALLAQSGMIKDLCSVDPESKKITGWHVRISYFHPNCFRDGGKPPSRFCHSVDSRTPNALRADSGNALRETQVLLRKDLPLPFFEDGDSVEEDQLEGILYFNAQLVPLGWKPVTKLSAALEKALKVFDADRIRELVDGVVENSPEVSVPSRKTLVRLLWENY